MILGFSVDSDPAEKVIEWIEERALSYPMAIVDQSLAIDYRVIGFPTLFVIDPQGRIHTQHTGVLSQAELEVLLDEQPGNVLLNCSAGKERTGVGTALVLSALGVPRPTILYDFMLSAEYFPAGKEVPRVREKYNVQAEGEAGTALIMPLLETRQSYLDAALDAVDADHGNVEQFLRTQIGLGDAEFAALRARFTG